MESNINAHRRVSKLLSFIEHFHCHLKKVALGYNNASSSNAIPLRLKIDQRMILSDIEHS